MGPVMREVQAIYHVLLSPVTGGTHAERLARFYAPQAHVYDKTRERLLHGRSELIDAVPCRGQRWIDIGAGTGSNLELMAKRDFHYDEVHLVDLCAPLLQVARARIERLGIPNVELQHRDALSFLQSVDRASLITCSYSLTMIPEWYLILEQALRVLNQGGVLGIVDFYTSRKHPDAGARRHSWLQRHVIPAIFARDNVSLSADHLPWLRHHYETLTLRELDAPALLCPLIRVPYYIFVGQPRKELFQSPAKA